MPVRWDDTAHFMLLMGALAQNPDMKIDAEFVVKNWPDESQPSKRTVTEHFNMLKKRAVADFGGDSADSAPQTPRRRVIHPAGSGSKGSSAVKLGSNAVKDKKPSATPMSVKSTPTKQPPKKRRRKAGLESESEAEMSDSIASDSVSVLDSELDDNNNDQGDESDRGHTDVGADPDSDFDYEAAFRAQRKLSIQDFVKRAKMASSPVAEISNEPILLDHPLPSSTASNADLASPED